MINLFSKLNSITVINEAPLAAIDRKQASIYSLFPEFDSRVKEVGVKGGIELSTESPGLWGFKVASVTQKPGSKIYDVMVFFKNIEEMINKLVQDRRLWNSDKSSVDKKKLAAELLNKCDIEISCNCPASLYFGMDYIQTQKGTKYGDRENRPPEIKNPRQYGHSCKHAQAVLDALPFYSGTLSKHLNRFFNKNITRSEKETSKVKKEIKKGAEFLKKKEEEERPEEPKKKVGEPDKKKDSISNDKEDMKNKGIQRATDKEKEEPESKE